jgi:hypothetical protein
LKAVTDFFLAVFKNSPFASSAESIRRRHDRVRVRLRSDYPLRFKII